MAQLGIANDDQPARASQKLYLRVGPTELIFATLRIVQVNWRVTLEWAPATALQASGANASIDVPNAPSTPHFLQIELTMVCRVAGWINGVYFPDQTFPATPSSIRIEWSNAGLTAEWMGTYRQAADRIVVEPLFLGVTSP
ncbi:hypothetical protein SAMN02745121_06104 [Nannocystis exedens]|uniref:Uncharacterized protein n=1 Tax=Nannocystis exedens TaxID=54 RepID=A0A1I2ELU6_9BACT|nr:hypothetical protein [Nannocystis exedens]PCC73975.1 hypothetical protein NAEX_07064 [Nannocystis exedens]SFE93351.1 hypothetical protein SAMN02745121_06104 [Nannocystis exedens]